MSIAQNGNSSNKDAPKPIERILALLPDAKGQSYNRHQNPGYTAHCPAHNDRKSSLLFWEDLTDSHVGIVCWAGCTRKAVVEALGVTESDLYLNGYSRASPKETIELFDLAAEKLIHPHLLDKLGVTDRPGGGGVLIPYYTMDGERYARERIRTALTATNGSYWNKGTEEVIPYGLERLATAREAGYLPVFEGESDCWTNWQRGLPALGIPGVQHYGKLRLDYLAGIERVYIMQEPPSKDDQEKRRDPGKQFVEDTYKHLLKIGYKGRIFVLNLFQAYGVKDPNELHKRNPKEYKALFEQAIARARPLSPARLLPETRSFKDLMEKVLPPIRWIVPGMIAEGLTLFAGKQKLGKSWMLLALGLAVACGGLFLQSIRVDQSEVLYLALEDNERRLQDRLRHLLPEGGSVPEGFHYATKWPRLDAEGLQLLTIWLDEHPHVRLIILDTWGRVKPLSRLRNGYDADIDAASGIQALAMERNISVLATCHLRKATAEDALDELNATTGLSATADNILILKRERGTADASLWGTGREIDLDKAISYSDGHWELLGDGATYRLSREQKEVIDAITAAERPVGAKRIAEFLRSTGRQVSDGAIRGRLYDMKQKGLIKELERGEYTLLPNIPNTPNIANMSNIPNAEGDAQHTDVRQNNETLGTLGNTRETKASMNERQEPTRAQNVRDVSYVRQNTHICHVDHSRIGSDGLLMYCSQCDELAKGWSDHIPYCAAHWKERKPQWA